MWVLRLAIVLFCFLLFTHCQDFLTKSINEDKPKFSTVHEFPKPASNQRYSAFQSGDPKALKLFEVAADGKVTTKDRLQYRLRERNFYDLIVLLHDKEKDYGGKASVLRISVIDTNNHNPKFKKHMYYGNIYEGLPAGSTVLGLEDCFATDEDSSGIVDYAIAQGDKKGLFAASLEDVAGLKLVVIKTTGTLNRDDLGTTPYIDLTIQGNDGGTPRLYGQTIVRVRILDKNDNPPVFTYSTWLGTVQENAAVMTSVLQVSASDDDEGSNAEVYYYLQTLNDDFYVDASSGIIYVAAPLSFERRSSYTLVVVAADRSPEKPRMSTTNVQINLVDVPGYPVTSTSTGSSAPTFDKLSYNIKIRGDLPSQGVVIVPRAFDSDSSGGRGQLSYTLSGSGSNNFLINRRSGVITLRQSLDPETSASYTLTVAVRDSAGLSASAGVTIKTQELDRNMYSPTFYPATKNLVIKEDIVIDTEVTTVSASDLDSGINGKFTYVISDGTGMGRFKIDANSGQVTTKVAFKAGFTYDLYILARDQGKHSRSGLMYVQVYVSRADVATPLFSSAMFINRVEENQPQGTFATAIFAESPDPSRSITYEISGLGSSGLALNPSTGVITTTQGLDYEVVQEKMITVSAKLTGTNLVSKTLVRIEIVNANDNPPAFPSSVVNVRLRENAGKVQSVACMYAEDRDGTYPSGITYSITQGNTGNTFMIDPMTGQLSAKDLDYEKVNSYDLKIKADDGFNSAVATVYVVVVDTDDPPKFEMPEYSFILKEMAPAGMISILKVDSTNPAEHTCDFLYDANVTPEFLSLFDLKTESQACVLSTKKIGHKWTKKHPSYHFTVRAINKANINDFSRAEIVVSIDDENNHAPVFRQTSYAASIYSSTPSGRSILTVIADDLDDGLNGDVFYELVPSTNSRRFSLSSDGVLTVSGSLVENSLYQITVRAKDKGSPSRGADVPVEISIHPSSAQIPQFTGSQTSFTVSELQQSGFQVGRVSVTSSSGVNYDIVGGNQENVFNIDGTGRIVLLQKVEYESHQSYSLVIRATQGSSPPAVMEKTFTVEVQDYNDHPPIFAVPSGTLKAVIDEYSPTGTIVSNYRAFDRDGGKNGKITYTMSGTDKFRIDAASGIVTTKQEMRRGAVNEFSYTVRATDDGSPSKSAEISMTVTVQAASRPPTFSSPQYRANLDDNVAVGTSIVTLTTANVDSTLPPVYQILEGNINNTFCIDPSRKAVIVQKQIDRDSLELGPNGALILKVDLAVRYRNASAHVLVTMQDDNDNSPEFVGGNKMAIKKIKEGEGESIAIFKAEATDKDAGKNSELKYSIYQVMNQQFSTNTFDISETTGEVRLLKKLNFEELSQHMITIKAEDQGTVPRFSLMELEIDVEDANDVAPVFSDAIYKVQIASDAQADTTVVTVKATDLDSGTNGVVRYEIVGSSSLFDINPITGLITLKSPVALVDETSFVITVKAKDQGTPSFSGQASVHVQTVTRDAVPNFVLHTFTFNVTENNDPQTAIGRAKAISLDMLTYSIVGGNTNDTFTIMAATGQIRSKEPLDAELATSYKLQVRATDTSDRQSEIGVIINVQNQWDNSPQFLNAVNGLVEAVVPRALSVGQMAADVGGYDRDVGDVLRYFIEDSTNTVKQYFQIDNTGTIRSTQSLDNYNVITVEFKVKAEDRGSNTKEVNVKLIFANFSPGQGVLQYNVIETRTSSDGSVISSLPRQYQQTVYSFVFPASPPFTIDQSNGNIRVRAGATLDYETVKEYTLVVQETNRQQITQYINYELRVQILDSNDNTPRFTMTNYIGKVNKNAQSGTRVFQLTAEDPDSGSAGRVGFEVVSPNVPFSVDPNTNQIKTSSFQLTNDWYNISVRAFDYGFPQKASDPIIIYIQTGNDPPTFTNSLYEMRVPENSPPGFVAGTVVGFSFSGISLRYRIVSGDPQTKFTMNFNGQVLLQRSVDFETDPEIFNLKVEAEEVSNQPLKSTVDVVVQIMNVNDNPPAFTQAEYRSKPIPENVPINKVLMQLTATDCDCSRTCSCVGGSLTYTADKFKDTLRVDPITGEIRNIRPLDFDTIQSYRFQVKVYDGVNTGTADVFITLQNVNDNAPHFQTTSATMHLAEDIGRGTVIMTIQAQDVDGDQITYTILSGDTANFEVEPKTGVIRVTTRQTPLLSSDRYVLNISAFDGLNSGYFALTVVIDDVNDNSPVFTTCSAYQGEVYEQAQVGTPVIQVQAKDKDRGRNGRVEYFLRQPDKGTSSGAGAAAALLADFTIDNTTGLIKTNKVLNREEQASYIVLVIALDGGHGRSPAERNSAGCQLEIQVLDINDFDPVFAVDNYEVSISENTVINTVVLEVSAQDQDTGENARITYSIRKTANEIPFKIDSVTGAITVSKSLASLVGVYSFRVEASDNGKPNKGKSDVEVKIVVQNAFPPKFNQTSYRASIKEDTSAGAAVLSVQALSQHGDQTSKIFFSILPGNLPSTNKPQKFTINSKSGQVMVAGELDFEILPEYVLEVQALDSGNDMKTNTKVHIYLIDVNDNAPIFTLTKYEFGKVAENQPSGQIVESVNATDADSGRFGEVSYSLEKSTDSDKFTIDSVSGTIRTAVQFDREKTPSVRIVVMCEDQGVPPLSSNVYVTITITDENDEKPFFKQTDYEVEVIEDKPIDYTVVTVEAFDKDAGENAMLNYYIVSGNEDGYFGTRSLHRSDQKSVGFVVIVKPLDRELKDTFNLRIAATDSKSNAFANVKIKVLDANDNDPVFLKPVYNGSIAENVGGGVLITQVTATDRDMPSVQKQITYFLGEQIADFFVIDAISGVIRTAGNNKFDREKQSSFLFQVFATDGTRTGVTLCKVIITDINDEAPYFPDAPYRRSVQEEEPPNTSVGFVTASDRDDPEAGGNARVTYYMTDNAEGRFTIDVNTGLIKTLKKLDREATVNVFTVTVQARDNGQPQLSGSTTVTITLTDANDQDPYFEKLTFAAKITECAEVGFTVTAVKAKDNDIGINAQLIYYITKGNTPRRFRVDADTGAVTVAYRLDYESDKNFELEIDVRDKGVPQRSSKTKTKVSITVEDCNDNPPVFDKTNYETAVYENVTVGTTLLRVTAHDNDIGINGEFTFGIDNMDDNYQFGIRQDPTNYKVGFVYLLYELDRETVEQHIFKVTATDKGNPSLTGYAQITVVVLDVNDNGPKFVPPDFCGNVKEETDGVQTVTTIVVSDPDGPGNICPCTFRIDSDPSGLFLLDSETGVMTTSARFDREVTQVYEVRVSATDSGSPPMTSRTFVIVEVEDVNDNPPSSGGKLSILLNAYKSTFIGGAVGKVYIKDNDRGTNDIYTHNIVNQRPGDYFTIDVKTGLITAKQNVPIGTYSISVSSKEQNREGGGSLGSAVSSSVEIVVRGVSETAGKSSLGIRMTGLTKPLTCKELMYPEFEKLLAELLNVPVANVAVFSAQEVPDLHRGVDIRFAVKKTAPGFNSEVEYVRAIDMIPILSVKKSELEKKTGGKVASIGVDKCAEEPCPSGFCYNDIQLQPSYDVVTDENGIVPANPSSKTFVSIRVVVKAICLAFPRKPDACKDNPCLNGGTCVSLLTGGFSCVCPSGYDGPQCQLTTCSFQSSSSYMWLSTFNYFYEGEITFEFATKYANGLLLYQGPVAAISTSETRDYLLVELFEGHVRLTVTQGDFRSFTMILRGKKLNDNVFHHVRIYKRSKFIQVTVDRCMDAQITESHGFPSVQDRTACEISGIIQGKYRFINGLNPLQIGGIKYTSLPYPEITQKSFEGCLRKLTDNGIMYDLANPLEQRNTVRGCPAVYGNCPVCINGLCDPTSMPFKCNCFFGWRGLNCDIRARSLHYMSASYAEYNFIAYRASRLTWFDQYITSYQLQVRASTSGVLIWEASEIMDQSRMEYSILEIVNSTLKYRYNVGDGYAVLELRMVNVSDSRWHNVSVYRVGNRATLTIHNVAMVTKTVGTHQLLNSNGLIYAGGVPANVIGRNDVDVAYDMRGCLSDCRINWVQADSSALITKRYERVDNNCPYCNIICMNGGTCIGASPAYCLCPPGYTGLYCGDLLGVPIIGSRAVFGSDGYVIIIVMLLIFLLALILIALLLSGVLRKAKPVPVYVDDTRDNIMPYHDEGAGEDDFYNYDMEKLLKHAGAGRAAAGMAAGGAGAAAAAAGAGGGAAIAAGSAADGRIETEPLISRTDVMFEESAASMAASSSRRKQMAAGQVSSLDVAHFIETRVGDADNEDASYPRDTLLHYGYEGEGSDVDDLSELGESDEESSDEEDDFAFLSEWGPKFDNLSKLFNPPDDDVEEDV